MGEDLLEKIRSGCLKLAYHHEVFLEDTVTVDLFGVLEIALHCIHDEVIFLEVHVYHAGILRKTQYALLSGEALYFLAGVVEQFINEGSPHIVLGSDEEFVEMSQTQLRDQAMGLIHLEGMKVGKYFIVKLFPEEDHLGHKFNDVVLRLRKEV